MARVGGGQTQPVGPMPRVGALGRVGNRLSVPRSLANRLAARVSGGATALFFVRRETPGMNSPTFAILSPSRMCVCALRHV